MIIEQLHIDSFGSLHDRTYHFTDGVNIIEGNNESGKSTLSLFIKFMFYGFSGRSGEREHGVSFSNNIAKGTLVCLSGGKRYRIERTVIASGGSFRETLRTIDLDTGAPAFPKTEPGIAFFGVDADVFCNTAFIRQLGGSTIGGKALRESVENILFSGNEDINTKKAIRKLDEMRVFYLHKNKKGGRLIELEQEQSECAARLKSAKEAASELETIRMSIDVAKKTRDENSETANACRARLSAGDELRALKQYSMTDQYRKKAKEAQAKADALILRLYHSPEIPETDYVTELKLAAADLRYRQAACAEAEKNLREISFQAKQENPKEDLMQRIKANGGIDPVRDMLNSFNRTRFICLICSILFLLLGLTGATLTILRCIVMQVPQSLHIIVSAALFAVSLFFFLYRSAQSGKLTAFMQEYRCDTADEFDNFLEEYSITEARLNTHTEQFSIAEKMLSDAQKSMRAVAQKGAALLNELKDVTTPDIDPLQLRPEHLESIAEQLQFAVRELDKLLREAEQNRALCTDVVSQMVQFGTEDEIQERIAQLHTILDEGGETWQSPEELNRKLNFALKANEALEQRLAMLYEQQAAAQAKSGDPAELSEKLDQLKAEYAKEHKKFLAYQLALDTLSGASEQLRSAIAPLLCRSAGSIIEDISDGKYSVLGLDEDYQLYYTDASGTRRADFLSAGTQDLAYFGLRLALTDVLFSGEKPPMIFDESFAKMDLPRLNRTMTALTQLAKGENPRQTILFTCHNREAEIAEQLNDCKIIRLETI